MTKDNTEYTSMDEMLDQIDASMKRIKIGDMIKGKIIGISDNEILVNIGFMADGIIPKEEISDDEDINLRDMYKVDDEVYVYVEKVNDGEGNVLLSKKKADGYKTLEQLENCYKNGTVFSIDVKEVVKGGLIALVNGIRVFMPASQVSCTYVEDLNKFVDKNLEVKIIELDIDKEKIIVSRKEVEKEEIENKREYILNNLKKGEKVKGTVKRITKFGAFVDLGGIDGLIHVSQMSWKRVNDPSEVVSVGDIVEVYVLDVDREKGKISLALKEVNKNPWESINEKYRVNDIISGAVVKFINAGAFVEIGEGIEGFVHISEICDERIAKPSDVLKLEDKVNAKILEINENDKRISLSIKAASDKRDQNYENYKMKNLDEEITIGDIMKDKLKNFKFE